jgi:hypothetical protein
VVLGPDTLNQVVARLLGEEFDILYLVCHGKMVREVYQDKVLLEEPRLYLEDPAGRVKATAGGEVVSRLAELPIRPRLVVLVASQSVGAGDDFLSGEEGALAAIGPKLAEVGIPAVLAMQARLSMKTAEEFFPTFFEELARHGQVDQAVAVARGRVRERDDFWVPVLYTRITHGRIWYVPEFATPRGEGFDGWAALLTQLKYNLKYNLKGRTGCTPILGSGLLEGLIGSTREVAVRWADAVGLALAPSGREDLPQVAQYLSVMEGSSYPHRSLENRLREQVVRRFGDMPFSASLDDLLRAARVRIRQSGRVEPHEVLARLPFPIYITANPDNQLHDALVEIGKQPIVELCRWHSRPDYDWPPSAFDDPTRGVPSVERPLVYHLFGQIHEPETLVLTEDDYFDYLIGLTRSGNLVPTVVKQAMAFSALLFLGFRVEEWNFSVMFRSILIQGDRLELSNRFKHISVMKVPEDSLPLDPERARWYLQKFLWNSRIVSYWGTVEDFVRELGDRWLRSSPFE